MWEQRPAIHFRLLVPPRPARERTEELERASLSAWATLSAETKGREQREPADRLRTTFQIDRDRIMSCGAFARLGGKTHSLVGDRSRLDHTLRTSRIARNLARALGLNEDLTEAIGLGRDLGATAFGRAGADALGLFTEPAFQYNHQSVRVTESLENGGSGLNLTWEVRDGIACHTIDSPTPATREGEVVRLCHRIADLTGVVADALQAGAVMHDDLPEDVMSTWGADPGDWVSVLIDDAVNASADTPEVRLGNTTWALLDRLGAFAVDQIIARHTVVGRRTRATHCLSSLVVFYLDNPDRLPAAFRSDDSPPLVCVVDFVASVSDADALGLFAELFLPRST